MERPGILIGGCLFAILCILILYIVLHTRKEGFQLISDINQQTFGPSWTQYVTGGAQKFNPLMNLIAPSRNTLLPPNYSQSNLEATQTTIQQALQGAIADPDGVMYSLKPSNVDDILINPESKGSSIQFVKKCEAVMTTDCNAFSNNEFAAGCGICLDGGVDSNGSPKVGGLYISPDDRAAAEYNAKKMGARQPNYSPTVGKCTPNKFIVSQEQCQYAQNELRCQKQGSFDTPGCAQCLQDGSFHYISKDSRRDSPVLVLIGNGKATLTTVSSSSASNTKPIVITLSTTPQTIDVTIMEGDSIQIAIGSSTASTASTASTDSTADTSGILSVAGYLRGNTASGKFTMDIFSLISIDIISNNKPRIFNNVLIDSVSCTSIRPGISKTSMNLILINPFTFLDPLEEESLLCPTSPYVTTETSAVRLNSSPCFTAGQSPGSYSLACVQSIFQNAGCTSEGNLFPTDKPSADRLTKDANGNPLNVGQIGNAMIQLYTSATTGKDSGGTVLPISDWDVLSMQCLGIKRTNECDKYDTGNGPLGADCLNFLYRNSGSEIRGIGNTYNGGPNIASLSSNKPQYCTSRGKLSPLKPDGSPNQAAIDIANSKKGVTNVKQFYDSISRTANDNSKSDKDRSLAIEQCYGVTLTAPIRSW